MYIFKNVFRNILRSKGRNILIGIITLVIAVSSCLALAIKQSANSAQEHGLKNVKITANISIDRQSIMQQAQGNGTNMQQMMSQYQNLSLDEMLKYSESEHVKEFIYSMTTSIDGSDTFTPFVSDSSTESDDTAQNSDQASRPNGGSNKPSGNFNMGTQGDFSLTGYSSENSMTSFINGTCKIKEGEIFSFDSEDNNCIISDELAAFNNLKTGDKITMTNPNNEEEVYSLTIKGIYTNSQSTVSGTQMHFSTSSDPANHIITSYNVAKKIVENSKTNATTSTDDNGRELTTALRNQESGTYIFNDVKSYEAFKTDVKSMGLSEYYTVSSQDVSNYDASIQPLKNLSNFANTFLYLVLIIGGIILVVLNIFNIRERKYEVGVLTAVGMKKWKVATQFITELFVVTFATTIIGTAIGASISVPTANKLLESQISQTQSQEEETQNNFGIKGNNGQFSTQDGNSGKFQQGNFKQPSNAVEYLSQINATVDFSVVLKLVLLGLGLALLASLSAVVFILRYEPLKILTNRT